MSEKIYKYLLDFEFPNGGKTLLYVHDAIEKAINNHCEVDIQILGFLESIAEKYGKKAHSIYNALIKFIVKNEPKLKGYNLRRFIIISAVKVMEG